MSIQTDKLRNLKDGWLDGKGFAPAHEQLVWLVLAFDNEYEFDLPKPYLYPTAEGGVQAEWSLAPHEITLEIDLAQKSGEWHSLNLDTMVGEEKTLDLSSAADWSWLNKFIRKHAGEIS